MKFYSQSVVEKIRKQREDGASIKTLSKSFHIPNTTISRWVRDVNSNSDAFNKARSRENHWKTKYQRITKDLKINVRNAKIFASLLYWCEGLKHPSSSCIGFVNSDYQLVKTFLGLLRKGFDINEQRIRIHLQIHTTHDYQQLVQFWGNLLKVPASQFYKPTITTPTLRMKRRNYLGTCTVKYNDVKLQLEVTGIFESFAKKLCGEVPEWPKGKVC